MDALHWRCAGVLRLLFARLGQSILQRKGHGPERAASFEVHQGQVTHLLLRGVGGVEVTLLLDRSRFDVALHDQGPICLHQSM